ncbi:hypothetical protein EZS27_006799 [termite gut metagenome]|uniref:Uncharacterized protein n=1 Tax=termite gut metagenome TaxID=433724 RepID=A0A5J4SK83_9ZZZZ
MKFAIGKSGNNNSPLSIFNFPLSTIWAFPRWGRAIRYNLFCSYPHKKDFRYYPNAPCELRY